MRKGKVTAAIGLIGMLLVIIDSDVSLAGAMEGINICIRTIIPALFPFLILSNLITGNLSGQNRVLLKPLTSLCGIPAGAEHLLIIGVVGGYPVGAQSVQNMYMSGNISKTTAERILTFCNNAGPAFIFGMVSRLFASKWTCWLIWLIQIISSLIIAVILPGKDSSTIGLQMEAKLTLTEALDKGIRSMVRICAWVILFRIIINYICKYIIVYMNQLFQVLFIGLLEIANGCSALQNIPVIETRFILINIFLSFGGLCVWMQTVSVSRPLRCKHFIIGRIMHTFISALLAFIIKGYIS